MFDTTRVTSLTSAQRKLLARRLMEKIRPGHDDRRLVAYVLLRSNDHVEPSDLKEYLATHLPAYMVPAAFMILDELPRSPGGKIDRQALPSVAQASRRHSGTAVIAPRNEIERAVAGIWQEVLGLSRVGVDENFFDLGGHSLLLVRLQSKLRNALGADFTIVDLFRYPTVSSLAKAIHNKSDPHSSSGSADDALDRASRQHAAYGRRNSRMNGGTVHE